VSCMRNEWTRPWTSGSGPRMDRTARPGSSSSGTAPSPGGLKPGWFGSRRMLASCSARPSLSQAPGAGPGASLYFDVSRSALRPEPAGLRAGTAALNARSAADGADRRRRSRSCATAAATADLSSRRCRAPENTGTSRDTADTAVKARNIHDPVTSTSPTPMIKGRTAPRSSMDQPAGTGGCDTVSGSATELPANPSSASRAPDGAASTTDMDELPQRIREPIATAVFDTRLPSTSVPLMLPRSTRVSDLSVTSSLACSRERSASGIVSSALVRPIR
jgi:hypothetical protein